MRSTTFWDAVPRRLLEWSETDDGRCILLRPKFGSGPIGRCLASRCGNPCYRIQLDDLGTFVWKSCNGETSLEAIAVGLRRNFGLTVDPVEARLEIFIRKMLRAKVLELIPDDSDS